MKFAELMAGTSLQFFGESAADREATGVSCDTRTMRAGDIFFAVAPQFARTALEAGASAVVLQSGTDADGLPPPQVIWSQDMGHIAQRQVSSAGVG